MASLAGTLIRGDMRPDVPNFNRLDAGEEQLRAIGYNQDALPGAQALVSDANRFTMEEINRMLEFAIPNYESMTGQMSSNINSLLRGEVPDDVSEQIQTNAAVSALTGGFGGSGMHGNLMARDLGLTSLGLMQQGENSAQRWTALSNDIFAPGMMNVSSMFLSPQQVLGHQVSERDKKWDVQWLRSQIAAQPGPMENAFAGLFDTVAGIGGSVVGSYAGSAVGGTQGGGGGGM